MSNRLLEKYVWQVRADGLQTNKNATFGVNGGTPTVTFNGPVVTTSTLTQNGALTVKSTSASALTVGANGATNPALKVDASTASSATGLSVKSAAAAAGVAATVISSGTNENLTIDAKGSGTITLNGTATGAVVIGNGLTLGTIGVTGTQTLASSATIALTVTNQVITHTPTQSETINMAAVPSAGTEVWLVVTTSGSSSFTLTFGTNFKTTGTLATGVTSGKVFVVNFVSDGTNMNEVARTTAM